MENIQELKKENKQLKEALALCINVSLVKKLLESLQRIKRKEYISEEEFFKHSPQESF